jgi:hypothetical protein
MHFLSSRWAYLRGFKYEILLMWIKMFDISQAIRMTWKVISPFTVVLLMNIDMLE